MTCLYVLTNDLEVHEYQHHEQEHELWQASKARDWLNEKLNEKQV